MLSSLTIVKGHQVMLIHIHKAALLWNHTLESLVDAMHTPA